MQDEPQEMGRTPEKFSCKPATITDHFEVRRALFTQTLAPAAKRSTKRGRRRDVQSHPSGRRVGESSGARGQYQTTAERLPRRRRPGAGSVSLVQWGILHGRQ
eukprot:scaffold1667_cov258-Pinguiococcus_pyrenoidosus.AAC.14